MKQILIVMLIGISILISGYVISEHINNEIDQGITHAVKDIDAQWERKIEVRNAQYKQGLKDIDAQWERKIEVRNAQYIQRLKDIDAQWQQNNAQAMEKRDAQWQQNNAQAMEKRDAQWQQNNAQAMEKRDAQWQQLSNQNNGNDISDFLMEILPYLII